jgi:hypothetical protein
MSGNANSLLGCRSPPRQGLDRDYDGVACETPYGVRRRRCQFNACLTAFVTTTWAPTAPMLLSSGSSDLQIVGS